MSNQNPARLGTGNELCRRLDRISDLPDSVLVEILSFIPTRLAVKTSILSKRWKSLWTTTPSFRFDDAHGTCSSTLDRKRKFKRFVNNVLKENNSLSIHKFRLYTASISSESKSEVGSWITNAITRKVREIDVNIPCAYFVFPEITFTCETLAVLKLIGSVTIRVPNLACLPNLKTMVLHLVRYRDSESATNLITCCPELENLSISRVEWFDNKTKKFIIHARKLKCLEIDLDFHPQLIQIQDYDINAPSLEYLDIKDYASSSLSLTNVGCLKKANICVGKASACQSVVKCFEAFNNLEFLSLSCSRWNQLLQLKANHLFPGLEAVYLFNLTHLTMAVPAWRSLLPYFLKCFPNLQVLRLVHK